MVYVEHSHPSHSSEPPPRNPAEPMNPWGHAAAPSAPIDETVPSMDAIRDGDVLGRLSTGMKVGKHFVLDRLVGKGGMGVVYRAWQDDLERWVAIKFVGPGCSSDDLDVTLFRNEVRAMARCPHPNVVPIHATGDYEGVPFFVMDLVEGQSLEEWVKAETTFDEARYEKAFDIILQACDAVAHLHDNGLIHRDIKPSNFLLKNGETVQLTDFGVARHRDDLGLKGYVVGSPQYMAPEVFFGDAAAENESTRDVYALACVAFEVLTGVALFNADTPTELLHKHMFEVPERPSRLVPRLPVAFDAVLARALAKNARERTPSVAAFRADLVAAHDTGRDPERILVLDDDRDWAAIVSSLLKKRFRNARVDVIEDPHEALLAVDVENYSVIVADLQMPALSGLEWTRKVRATRRGRDLPIVIVTGSGGAAEWKEASTLGVAAILLKPLNGDDLVNVVSRALRETSPPGKLAAR